MELRLCLKEGTPDQTRWAEFRINNIDEENITKDILWNKFVELKNDIFKEIAANSFYIERQIPVPTINNA